MLEPQRNPTEILPSLSNKEWEKLNLEAWKTGQTLNFEGFVNVDGTVKYWSVIDFRPAWPVVDWCPFAVFELVTCTAKMQRAYRKADVVAYELQLNYSGEIYWKDNILLRTANREIASEVAWEVFQAFVRSSPSDPEIILHAVSVAAVCRGISAQSNLQTWPYNK